MLRYSRLQSQRGWRGGINLTPLVDIVFQLIVFYMLGAQVITSERDPMQLPRPDHSEAQQKGAADRLVINLFAGSDGKLEQIKLNAQIIPDLASLVDVMLHEQPMTSEKKGKRIILRADRRLRFDQIEPVLQALSNASVGSLEIATELETKSLD
jgi:biopolymer transport protein ExbD